MRTYGTVNQNLKCDYQQVAIHSASKNTNICTYLHTQNKNNGYSHTRKEIISNFGTILNGKICDEIIQYEIVIETVVTNL